MSFKKIIDINGVPRSGTSWLSQIIDSCEDVRFKFQPLFSDSFKNALNLSSSRNEIIEYFETLYNFEDDYLDNIKLKRQNIYPIFRDKAGSPSILSSKHVTHHYLLPYLLKTISEYNVIIIIRNPCAVLSSFKHYPSDFNHNWDFKDEWEFAPKRGKFRPENYFGFNKWKEFAKLSIELKKIFSNRVYLVKYEELMKNPDSETEKIFNFYGMRLGDQTRKFINSSIQINKSDPLSVYKSDRDVNKWKADFNIEIMQKIYSDIESTELAQFL
ncbi:MAG: sulfotransferase [Vicingaceae bacterium]